VKLSTGSLNKSSPISPLDFGSDEIWYDNGYGAQNPLTNQLYPNVINMTKDIGVSILRYPGGIPSDTFHWQNAIGPQGDRSENVIYQGRDDIFLPSNFGPDEFGQLLQKTGAEGDITVNFGTGTAQEAADWVQYMTASSKTNYWGKLRAKNGHSAPYNIPYWEVGNETEASTGENYWRSGAFVSLGPNGVDCQADNEKLCQYVYGGITAFTDQRAIAVNNDQSSNGTPDQAFYAQYPPVASGSQVVYVNGRAWAPIGNINNATPGELVYQLNNTSGKIIFGDGIHGAILPKGSIVTISYHSGPHDGFIEYYNLMKAADPSAHICSSYESISFIELMGSSNPYDCLVSHLYGSNIASTNTSPLLFHNSLMQQSNNFSNTLTSEQAAIKEYAGTRAKDISIDVTEYGVNAYTSPAGYPDYHRSMDMALFVANSLKVMIDDHIPVAEKHYLISYENSQPSGLSAYINSSTFSDNALIGGPGPDPVLQPSAYVIEAYTKLLYSNLISSDVKGNPSVLYNGGSYPSLSVVATTNKQGDESIMVINLSPSKTIKAEVMPSISTYKEVNTWTLGANSFLAYNTPNDTSVVGFVSNSLNLKNGQLSASFPPGSVTVMQFK
jgi:alpha-N-arabinofuranosidase